MPGKEKPGRLKAWPLPICCVTLGTRVAPLGFGFLTNRGSSGGDHLQLPALTPFLCPPPKPVPILLLPQQHLSLGFPGKPRPGCK